MQQLSSSWTMPVKLFLPAFIGGILGAFFFIVWIYQFQSGDLGTLRMLSVVLIALGAIIYVRWIHPLKRVDGDDAYLYITDYLTTIRYPLAGIKAVQLSKNGRKGVISLYEKSRFGQEISFLASAPRVSQYLAAHSLGK